MEIEKLKRMSVKELRDLGYLVKVFHNRKYMNSFIHEDYLDVVSPHGGDTRVSIIHPDGGDMVSGFANCNPKDNYNKKVAVKICIGRAIPLLAERQLQD